MITVNKSETLTKTHILHRLNLDLIGGQEEDDAEDPTVHFGDRDGEDHHPGEEAGQGVD